MAGADKVVDRIKARHKQTRRMTFSIPKNSDEWKERARPENRAGSVAGSLNLARHDFKGALGDVETLFTPEIPDYDQPIIPIPDESLQANEARRRRARQSRTGRQSTMLTGGGSTGEKLGG